MHYKCNKKNFLIKKVVWLSQRRSFPPQGRQRKAGLLLIVLRVQAVMLEDPIFTHKIQAKRKDKYDYKHPYWQRVTKQTCMWMAVVI